jgi:arylsulfatase A-like enzyme
MRTLKGNRGGALGAATAGFLALGLPAFAAMPGDARPNIVFILADDLGISDLGAFGARFYETPNIDALMARGCRLASATTSAPICAPARASAMTGKHPLKLGMWTHHHHMPAGEPTVAARLKAAGYATWHVGKWHCGTPESRTLPQDVGFDINIAGWEAWAPSSYFWPYRKKTEASEADVPSRFRVPGLEKGGREGEYLTDRLTDEAVKLIQNHDGRSPFFLNLWHFAVHEPVMAKPEKIKKYRDKLAGEPWRSMPGEYSCDAKGTKYIENPNMGKGVAIYAAMIESVDESVGRVVAALKARGVYENTLVIFYSDNGPLINRFLRTPFRGGKNSTYQGGVRMPASITWEAKIKPGGVCNNEASICDLPMTMLAAAGATFAGNGDRDGISLLPAVTGAGGVPETRRFVWYFPGTRKFWGQYASAALKDGDNWVYQMLFNGDNDELYNLNNDPLETENLIARHPERAKKMEAELRAEINKYYKTTPPPEKLYVENVERRLRGEPALRVQNEPDSSGSGR